MTQGGSGDDTFIHIPLRDAGRFIVRGLPLAMLFALIGIISVWLLINQGPASYTAVAYLLSVRQDHAPTVVRSLVPGSLDPSLYRAAVVNGPVLDEVRASWTGSAPLPDDFELLSNLRVISDNMIQSSVVRVEYRDGNADQAAGIANTVATELIAWDQARTLRPLQEWSTYLQSEISALGTEINQSAEPAAALLQARAQKLADLTELESTLPLNQLGWLSAAEVPTEHDGQGLVSGATVTIAVAVILAYLTQLARIAFNSASRMPIA